MPSHTTQPARWIDTAPIRTSTAVDIEAAPASVWAILVDHEGWPRWFTKMDRVEVTGPAAGVGATRRVVIQRLPFDEVFTAWEECRELSWAVTRSPLLIIDSWVESMRLHPTDTGTRLDYTLGQQAKRGFGRVFEFGWRRNTAIFDEALANLRRLAEA